MADFVNVDAPVGVRWRTQNVQNNAKDQARVIQLLGVISNSQGGKREAWGSTTFKLSDRICDKALAEAIWDFQKFWKNRGVFRNIDGVVDRDGNTIKKMNALAPSVAPIKVLRAVDIIVRFAGAHESAPLPEEEVFPKIWLPYYTKLHEQTGDRKLVRMGEKTQTVGEESKGMIARYVNDIKKSIDPNSSGHEKHNIFIYGSSSGGRNAIDLAANLTREGFKLRFVAVMDAAFFPNSRELTNSPDNYTGEPTVVPNFNVAPITAEQKFNYFQTLGNHSEVSFHGRLFTSRMKGKEIHGSINGFENIEINNELISKLPRSSDKTFDDAAHVALINVASYDVWRKIGAILNNV